jgi:nicotinamidase-related amidase
VSTGSGLLKRNDMMLVVIDVQERLAAAMDRRSEVVAATVRLIRLAALVGAPIVITRQNPDGLGDTVREIEIVIANARERVPVFIVDKLDFCACSEPEFGRALDEAERPTAVIVGMESHICVTQTALSLHASGRDVFVAADACCSRSEELHDIAMDRLRAAGVVVTTSESVMYEAVGRAGTDEFRELLAIVKGA